MKKFLSMIIALTMIAGLVPAMAESTVEYIPAPYTIAEGEKITDTYLEPVIYTNENGPSIGVTTLGVLKIDGLYFKDSDNDKELDVFEDWRLDDETRAKDLVSKLTLEQQAGLVFNSLFFNPVTKKLADVKDENGNVVPYKVMPVIGSGFDAPVFYGNVMMDSSHITDLNCRSAVYRGAEAYDPSIVALSSNIGNQLAEYIR